MGQSQKTGNIRNNKKYHGWKERKLMIERMLLLQRQSTDNLQGWLVLMCMKKGPGEGQVDATEFCFESTIIISHQLWFLLRVAPFRMIIESAIGASFALVVHEQQR